MKKTILILSGFSALLFTSCEQEIRKEFIEVPALSASSILKADSVYFFIKKCAEQQDQLYAVYKRKGDLAMHGDPGKAVYFYRRAITLFPKLEAYLELGKALMASKQFNEARNLYGFLVYRPYINDDEKHIEEYLFGKPDAETYYHYFLAQQLSDNYIDGYLIYEMTADSIDVKEVREKIKADPLFAFQPGTPAYNAFMIKFMTEEEIEEFRGSKDAFLSFLAEFPDSSDAYQIKDEAVYSFIFNSGDYEMEMEGPQMNDIFIHFLKEKQDDPDGWYDFNLNHRYKLNNDVYVVSYSIDSSQTACPAEFRHITHRLVTYTKDGKIIDSKFIALQSPEWLWTATVNKDKLTVYTAHRDWKNQYEMNDFDNEIIGLTPEDVREYRIKPDGIIEDVKILSSNSGVE